MSADQRRRDADADSVDVTNIAARRKEMMGSRYVVYKSRKCHRQITSKPALLIK